MRFLCNLGFHKWTKWKIVKIGQVEDKLIRRCDKCGKEDIYYGLTEICMTTGARKPYEYKH